MKKVKLSERPQASAALLTDKIALEGANIPISTFLKSLGIASGYFENTIPAGGEVDTGVKNIGLCVVNTQGSGNTAVILMGAFTGSNANKLIAASDDKYFSISDEANRMCVFRKTDSGTIFIKNNTAAARKIRIYFIMTQIG